MPNPRTNTAALEAITGGESCATSVLLPQVYEQLRSLASKYMCNENAGHLLSPTALVHEAYIRLIDVDRVDWRGKTHFFAMAATQMRRILIEHARAASAKKRAPGTRCITLDETVAISDNPVVEMLALEESLRRLTELSPRQARVAECRLYAGLSVKEVALALAVSERTAKQDWRVARAWLLRELSPGTPDP